MPNALAALSARSCLGKRPHGVEPQDCQGEIADTRAWKPAMGLKVAVEDLALRVSSGAGDAGAAVCRTVKDASSLIAENCKQSILAPDAHGLERLGSD